MTTPIKRYTVLVTKPIVAADMIESADGQLVSARDVDALERRVAVAREHLALAFQGPDEAIRARVGKALDALEGRP